MSLLRIDAPSNQLIPGETTRIPVVLVLDEATKVRGLHATFHGAEETKASYTTYNAATKSTEVRTATEYVEIVKRDFLLSGQEQKGFFGNIADGFATIFGGGEHEVLEPGEYAFETEIGIPADAAASFDGTKCRVFYELSAFVDIPVARDLKALQSFRVVRDATGELPQTGPVRTQYPEDAKRGLLDSWFLPELSGEAALREGTLRSGDTIDGIFQVATPKPLEYRAIDVRLITCERTQAHGHSDGHTHQGEPVRIATEGVIDGNYVQHFNLPVVLPGPPSVKGHLFAIECFVQIELDVPWAKDPKIRIPVTLAQ